MKKGTLFPFFDFYIISTCSNADEVFSCDYLPKYNEHILLCPKDALTIISILNEIYLMENALLTEQRYKYFFLHSI